MNERQLGSLTRMSQDASRARVGAAVREVFWRGHALNTSQSSMCVILAAGGNKDQAGIQLRSKVKRYHPPSLRYPLSILVSTCPSTSSQTMLWASTVSLAPSHPSIPRSFLSRTVHSTRQKSPIGLKSEFVSRRLQSQNNSTQGSYTPLQAGHSVIKTSTSCIAFVPTRVESNLVTVSRCQVCLMHHAVTHSLTVTLVVMLQPMKEEPPLSAKCKDKFLIQSTLITPEKETKDLQDIVRIPPLRHPIPAQVFLVECSQWRK